MKKTLFILIALLPVLAFGQFEFNNVGAAIYNQKGSLLFIDGSFTNNNGSTNGAVSNDGIIELKGDFENKTGAAFTAANDSTSKERAVKFIGSGTQFIKGDLNTPGTASLYNVVVDKAGATDKVEMAASVTVEGSLLFGTATSSTYEPVYGGIANNQKGLVKTYNGAGEYVLSITNGNTDAISGYADLDMDKNPNTGFILTSGIRESANGGLSRKVSSIASYVYPIGTEENGYNATRMNFVSIPALGAQVMGKFNDGTRNSNGNVGKMFDQCVNCPVQGSPKQGYNHYFAENACNANAEQWLILQDDITNHGYWSFDATEADNQFSYSIETFANSYNINGSQGDIWRTLKYEAAYSYDPTGVSENWSRYVDSVSQATDLLEFSKNAGTCYTGAGVPGGIYTGFGHYAMKKASTGGALPVELIYVNAEPKTSSIAVTWATAIEINNKGFEVQRSTDGVNFTTIGWVDGGNNSTMTLAYEYDDMNVQQNITYYYRLNQIDNDGASTFSYVVSAQIGGTTEFTVSQPMPNPAVDVTRMVVSTSAAQTVEVRVVDVTGRIVVENKNVSLSAGSNTISLDVQNIASGDYLAVVYANGKPFANHLIVTKN
ncbi:MAG: T9SS type A sorting domain-containing protein [Chitinophagales bacterium]